MIPRLILLCLFLHLSLPLDNWTLLEQNSNQILKILYLDLIFATALFGLELNRQFEFKNCLIKTTILTNIEPENVIVIKLEKTYHTESVQFIVFNKNYFKKCIKIVFFQRAEHLVSFKTCCNYAFFSKIFRSFFDLNTCAMCYTFLNTIFSSETFQNETIFS